MSPEQAAIRRATRAAQRAMHALDEAGRRELVRAYRSAAEDLRRIIALYAGPEDSVRLDNLRDLLRQVEGRLTALGEVRNGLLGEGLQRAAEYGARAVAVTDGAATMRVREAALSFVQAFVAADGLQLSDRLWRTDRQAREAVAGAIERAVIEGHSATQAARDFLSRGQAVPAALAGKMQAAGSGRIGAAASAALLGDGQAMQQATRLFRTEINRAHGEAYMLGGEDLPGFAGWRFTLSPAHPEHDICDLYAAQNLHGLGPGVYPDRPSLPWPAHPNTLSFVEIVFESEISEADRAGKESTLQALARLDPDVRRGVLGKNKAEAFEDGRLTTGMIRSPWREVQQRIARNREESGGAAPLRSGPPATAVVRFAEQARSVADRKLMIDLGPVDAARIRTDAGLDLSDYHHILDNYGVRHTLKSHGNPTTEAGRGQIAVEVADFALLPLIVGEYDSLRRDGQNKIGRDVLVFQKMFDGIGYRYVAELRPGKRLLVADSLRKKVGPWGI